MSHHWVVRSNTIEVMIFHIRRANVRALLNKLMHLSIIVPSWDLRRIKLGVSPPNGVMMRESVSRAFGHAI
jgi:hypothetical protein